jgi:hypothetical protein
MWRGALGRTVRGGVRWGVWLLEWVAGGLSRKGRGGGGDGEVCGWGRVVFGDAEWIR